MKIIWKCLFLNFHVESLWYLRLFVVLYLLLRAIRFILLERWGELPVVAAAPTASTSCSGRSSGPNIHHHSHSAMDTTIALILETVPRTLRLVPLTSLVTRNTLEVLHLLLRELGAKVVTMLTARQIQVRSSGYWLTYRIVLSWGKGLISVCWKVYIFSVNSPNSYFISFIFLLGIGFGFELGYNRYVVTNYSIGVIL